MGRIEVRSEGCTESWLFGGEGCRDEIQVMRTTR